MGYPPEAGRGYLGAVIRCSIVVGAAFLVLGSCGSSAPAASETGSGAAAAPRLVDPPPELDPPGLNEGPHLFLQPDGSVRATWIVGGELKARDFAAGAPIVLPKFAHLLGDSLELRQPKPPKSQWDAPATLLALSDVEGEYDTLLRFLTNNGVIGSDGRWAFGEGHLVGVGDMVDRGEQVTETLWLFYRLSLEAEAAGGCVHFVIGNHEAMMMGGDVRYTHKKYFAVAELMNLSCGQLLGANTVIGQWLRTRNCIERIGDYAFVHAGLSRQTVGDGLDYGAINATVRQFLGVPPNRIPDERTFELVWGRTGPLWYRGFFAEFASSFGPTPTNEQFKQLLAAAGVAHVVVGHTKVAQVVRMFDGGLIPIDIPWTEPANVRALVVRGDDVELVNIDGASLPLN